jgi:glucose-6-phosphate dehydrogenase assembly protein OpcA
VAAAVSRPTRNGQAPPRVSEDAWSGRDTNPDAIDAALRRLLRERHAASRALAPARVLNLIVVAHGTSKDAIAERLEHVGRYEASRTILCTVEDERGTIDATAVMSYAEHDDRRLPLIHEKVEIEVGPQHLSRLDTIVGPLLASELPTALWCPYGHEQQIGALLAKADVVLLDSDEPTDPRAALARAAGFVRSAYVVDLAWLRTAPWRERLAASFDLPERLATVRALNAVSIRHMPGSRASGLLLAGWLASRLRWDPGAGIEIALEPFDQRAPGLAGVTVSCRDGFSLVLDRGPGGLCARERSAARSERVWQLMGASRGEGGILGDGIRQAQLRDPTYAPALEVAQGLSHLRLAS